MKKSLFFSLTAIFTSLVFSFKISAQNTAPYWSLAGNNNATTTSILGTTNSVPLRLFTKNVARITIDTFGFVGINSTHPVSTLDVRGTQYLSGVLKFGTGAHGIQFANPTTTANKAMMYMFTSGTQNLSRMVIAHSTAYPNWGLQYNDTTDNFIFTNGISQKVSIAVASGSVNMTGALGVGSGASITGSVDASNSVSGGTGPKPYSSGIYSNGNTFKYNIIATNTVHGHWWGFWNSGSETLELDFDNAFRGTFNPTTGAYTYLSDAKLKTNIKPMESVLDKINQLKPSSYQIKDAKDQQFYDGFIAQDVLKIFPNLVQQNVGMDKKEILSMNYSGFGVIAVKGIQELQDIIKKDEENSAKQQDIIELLKDKITRLENIIDKLTPGQFQNINAGTSLEQNSPNPARNATSIGYGLPSNNSSAQLLLIDNLGRTVKTIQLNSSGRINLDLSSLSIGTYNYSLVIDGKVVETKKLVKASE